MMWDQYDVTTIIKRKKKFLKDLHLDMKSYIKKILNKTNLKLKQK